MYAFLVFIFIILGIYLFYNPSSKSTKAQQEGFQDSGLSPLKPAEPTNVHVEQPWSYKNVNSPVNATTPRISPPPVRNEGQQPNASDLPGNVPGAPYLQIARNDPRPYEDPTLVKTTVQRIKEIQERLKGFLAFKAQLISDRSDPQIQMPLSSARADFERLKSTLNVLSRNPDMQPTQTEQQMDEISDNLAYLERQAEKIQALSLGQKMPAPLKPSIFEGFEDAASKPENIAGVTLTDVDVGDVGVSPGHLQIRKGSILLTRDLSRDSLDRIYSANKSGIPYSVTVSFDNGQKFEFNTRILPIVVNYDNDNIIAYDFTGAPSDIEALTKEAKRGTVTITKMEETPTPPPMSTPPQTSTEPQPPYEPSNYSLPSTVSNTGLNDMSESESDRVTKQELQDFKTRILKEQERLSRSGTTDPLIQARLAGLDRIRSDVDDIFNRIQNEQMREDEIPIKKSEINDALKLIQEGRVPGSFSNSSANSLPNQATDTALSPIMPGLPKIPGSFSNSSANSLPNQATDTALSQIMPGPPKIPETAVRRFLDNVKISFGINYSDTAGGILNLMESNGLPGMDGVVKNLVVAAPELPNPLTNKIKISELNSTEIAPPPLFHTNESFMNFNRKLKHKVVGTPMRNFVANNEDICRKTCESDDMCKAYSFHWGNRLDPNCSLYSGTNNVEPNLYTNTGIKKMPTTTSEGFQNSNTNTVTNTLNSNSMFPLRTTEWVYNGGQAIALGSAGEFDWKERSKQITDQIRKRGMNPREMGAIPDGAQVSSDFNWKGYSRMLCTRLETSMDTGLAVACGCPPQDWQGWQIPLRS
ncbi:MAG: hypothetical protein EBT86_03175 [Actinobacteria bacterium]|nr:hypothetical protein [Actinomycetota bacterium]